MCGNPPVDAIEQLVGIVSMQWRDIASAPKAIPKRIFPVLVTRFPAKGKPPIMIAHLTSNGWCVKGYGLAPKQYDGKPFHRRYRPLHFQPTHWMPLPEAPKAGE